MAQDKAKRSVWRRRIALQRRSGLSVQAFCHDEGIALSTFYYWKRALCSSADSRTAVESDSQGLRFRQASMPGVLTGSRSAKPAAGGGLTPAGLGSGRFLPVTLVADTDGSAAATLEIEFPEGVRLTPKSTPRTTCTRRRSRSLTPAT